MDTQSTREGLLFLAQRAAGREQLPGLREKGWREAEGGRVQGGYRCVQSS